ncbi:ubiquitin carboxyl-terminal hydrolase [Lasallia pustulata]|uniref:Ubiquitin carboxyl-terminal hydrolase n=1 Tax=Lasallia pustulata TaxID=136370 RepID=A0A1W5DAH7_9LECA|nr:ubiquitin carboxyl-terminal hydrolase [Lasallia pustulata]
MTEWNKRRRLNGEAGVSSSPALSKLFPGDPSAPATEDDKKNWNGFCEIESEPAFFNVMLKNFGVKGVKVQEVVSLDEELLAYVPRPVFGLIFLFKWREDDPDKQEPSCPEGVWFANQTVDNACASVALLNIVNNIPSADLGEHLQQFKEFTRTFTPALRGDAIGNFDFVKQIHNSFARKMDLLNGDLQLKNDASARKNHKVAKGEVDDSDAGYHFIAFVPIDGKVWKLDGLERQPQNLGPLGNDDWLNQAKPVIEARMADYEEGQIEFAVLALAKDPLFTLVASLADNVMCLRALSARLGDIGSDSKDLQATLEQGTHSLADGTLLGPDLSYDLSEEAINQASVPLAAEQKCRDLTVVDLLAYRQELESEQANLRRSIKEEQESVRSDEARAASRRHDYGPMVQAWVRMLARKQALKPLIDETTGK